EGVNAITSETLAAESYIRQSIAVSRRPFLVILPGCRSSNLRPSRLRWGAIPAAVFLAFIDNIRCHSYNIIGFRFWRKLQKLCRAARRTFRFVSLYFLTSCKQFNKETTLSVFSSEQCGSFTYLIFIS